MGVNRRNPALSFSFVKIHFCQAWYVKPLELGLIYGFFFFFNFSYDVSPWWAPNEYFRSPRTTFMRPYLKKFTISSMATSLCDANFLVVVALVFFLLTSSNLVMNVLIDQLIILIIVAWLLSLLPPSGGCFPVFFVFFGYLLSSLHEGFFFFFF